MNATEPTWEIIRETQHLQDSGGKKYQKERQWYATDVDGFHAMIVKREFTNEHVVSVFSPTDFVATYIRDVDGLEESKTEAIRLIHRLKKDLGFLTMSA